MLRQQSTEHYPGGGHNAYVGGNPGSQVVPIFYEHRSQQILDKQIMKEELGSAVDFLTKILRTRNVAENKVDTFNTSLLDLLTKHYEDHWFPEKPFKGSAYR